jgi:RNA polymerase sigma factor (sigma-70 family)
MNLTMQIKEETFQREQKRLLSFIRNRVSSLEDAEDILQDVFYQFIAGFDTIQSIEKATSWLFAVARHKIIDRYRKNAREPHQAEWEGILDQEDEYRALSLEDILPDFGNSPEDRHLRDALWEAIAEALEELPAEQREVFVLQELEEQSFREISERTGIPINTLLSRKRYAVLALRKRLQRLYNDL